MSNEPFTEAEIAAILKPACRAETVRLRAGRIQRATGARDAAQIGECQNRQLVCIIAVYAITSPGSTAPVELKLKATGGRVYISGDAVFNLYPEDEVESKSVSEVKIPPDKDGARRSAENDV